MKKLIPLTILLSLFINSEAQIKFGVTAGLHSSDIVSATGVSTDASVLFHGGFVVDLKVPNSNLHIMGQALYTSLGYKNSNVSAVDKNETYIGIIGNEKIDYVQVPILALYQFGVPKLHAQLGAGPYVAFKTNETMKIENGGDTFHNTVFPIYTVGAGSVAAGGELYGSVEFSRYFASLDYQYNFNSIYKDSGSTTDWRLSSIGISLGVFLK